MMREEGPLPQGGLGQTLLADTEGWGSLLGLRAGSSAALLASRGQREGSRPWSLCGLIWLKCTWPVKTLHFSPCEASSNRVQSTDSSDSSWQASAIQLLIWVGLYRPREGGSNLDHQGPLLSQYLLEWRGSDTGTLYALTPSSGHLLRESLSFPTCWKLLKEQKS